MNERAPDNHNITPQGEPKAPRETPLPRNINIHHLNTLERREPSVEQEIEETIDLLKEHGAITKKGFVKEQINEEGEVEDGDLYLHNTLPYLNLRKRLADAERKKAPVFSRDTPPLPPMAEF